MAKQLVVLGNRIIAHGEDCFVLLPEGVLSTTDGKIYKCASIVEHAAELPADIDSSTIDYEYHAGIFVPCLPRGKSFVTEYTGTGTTSVSITCGFRPKMVVIKGKYYRGQRANNGYNYPVLSSGTYTEKHNSGLAVTFTDTGVTWSASNDRAAYNAIATSSSDVYDTENSFYVKQTGEYIVAIFG